MSMFYSRSTGGCYSIAVHGTNMPADVIELTDEAYVALFINPTPGKVLSHDENGYPILVDTPPPTPEQIEALNKLSLQQYTQLSTAQKNALTVRIGTLQDAIDLEMATLEEIAELPVRQAQLLDWKRYAVYLGRVTAQEGWALVAVWPTQPAAGMDLEVSATAPQTS